MAACGNTDAPPTISPTAIALVEPVTPTRLPNSTPTVLPTDTIVPTATTEELGVNNFTCRLVVTIPEQECEALVGLFFATEGEKWGNLYPGSAERWLSTDDPCAWFGVTCTNGNVTMLDLHESQLRGSLTSDIVNLTELDTITLYKNELTGPLPPELAQLGKLRSIDLSNNQLRGAIPAEWATFTSLEALNLNFNQLSGTLPRGFGELPNLGWLDLSYNQNLTGVIPSSYWNIDYFNTIGTLLAGASAAVPPATATPSPPSVSPTEPPTQIPTSATSTPNQPTSAPTATNTPRPTPTATPTLTAQEEVLAIVRFSAEISYLPNGDEDVTFTWETTGSEQLELWLGFHPDRAAFRQPVQASGTLTERFTNRDYFHIKTGLVASKNGRNETVEQSLVFQCEYDYFFDYEAFGLKPIGCPHSVVSSYSASYQQFERGFMIFFPVREGQKARVGVFPYGAGYKFIDDTWTSAEPIYDPLIVPPDGMYQPQYGFGKVWRENESIRADLGWATDLEFGFNGQSQAEENAAFLAFGTAYIALPNANQLLKLSTSSRHNTSSSYDILTR